MGLKNHSEIGWVLREYNNLIGKAIKSGIKYPDSYYAEGKVKGKTSRDKSIEGTKASGKSVDFVKKAPIPETSGAIPDISEEDEFMTPSRRPTLNELPRLTRKGRAVEIPSFLKGARHNR